MEGDIPSEIVDFFNNSGNIALLIKGDPGTGKTIFSLQYIASQAEEGHGIYFSTRVDTGSLYNQFPWIRKNIPPENIVDATQSVVPRRMDVPQLIRFSSLPEFLKSLYTVVEERKLSGPPLLVVDSIDAVASSVGLPIEDVCAKIVDTMRNIQVKTLIITERVEKSPLDYICDGVITFKRKYIDGRLFRELLIEKLRGVEIRHPIYYFTLHEGKFTYLKEFYPLKREKDVQEPHPVIKDGEGTEFYEKGMFSTGSRQLDNLLGGIKRGSFMLIEVLEEVSADFAIDTTAPVLENFMIQGRGVIVIPYKCTSPQYFINIYSSLVGSEIVRKHCKIVIPSKRQQADNIPWLVTTSYSIDDFLDTVNKLIDDSKKELDKNVLLFISFDKLEADFGSKDAEKIVMEFISRIKFEGDICIGVTFPSTKIGPKLKEMADYLFKFFCKREVAFIYGVHPSTKIFNVNVDFSKSHPTLYLTPIT